jgi:hypothetical protein
VLNLAYKVRRRHRPGNFMAPTPTRARPVRNSTVVSHDGRCWR